MIRRFNIPASVTWHVLLSHIPDFYISVLTHSSSRSSHRHHRRHRHGTPIIRKLNRILLPRRRPPSPPAPTCNSTFEVHPTLWLFSSCRGGVHSIHWSVKWWCMLARRQPHRVQCMKIEKIIRWSQTPPPNSIRFFGSDCSDEAGIS